MNIPAQLHEQEVHLYLLLLPQHYPELTQLKRHLTAYETARTDLLKCEQLKKRFVVARGVLREILGNYLGLAPQEVPLQNSRLGKPFLTGRYESVRFNLSHTGDYCLIACATNREVGVDIEMITPDKPLRDMARLVFSDNEQQELFYLPDSAFEAAFYRLWVRKEACLKAIGTGFSIPANSFDLAKSIEKKESAVSCNRKYWHVLEIDAPSTCCAAVAVERLKPGESPPQVIRFEHHLACGKHS